MKLNVNCPIGYTGYGIASLNILKELYHQGIDITLIPIGNGNIDSPTDKDFLESIVITKKPNWDAHAPFLKIWHQFELLSRFGSKSPYFAYSFFELNNFSEDEKKHLSVPDVCITASGWGKTTLERAGRVKRAEFAPLGVDRNIFNDFNRAASEKCIFINIGKAEIRKGHDVLIEIFNDTFNENDDVELWWLPFNPFVKPEVMQSWHDRYLNCRLKDKVRIFPRINTQYELAHIIKQATCGVFPARAEGFNLELLECMSCGLDVIATDYSAHTEFITEKNCQLIKIDKLEPAYDGLWFFGNVGEWAKIGDNQRSAIAKAMKTTYNKWQAEPLIINSAGIETAEKFNWANTAAKIITILKENI